MRTTEQRTGTARRPGGRIRPSIDRLEPRLALSGSAAGLPQDVSSGLALATVRDNSLMAARSPIAHADPAPGAVLGSSPLAFSITFDRAIDRYSIGNTDFTLVHVADDSSTSPLSASEARLSESADLRDLSGTKIVVSLSRPIADGRYRLLLAGGNHLGTLDGTPLTADGRDLEVSTFTIRKPGVGLAGAVNLGTATTIESVRTDTLDLISDPGSIKLYKLTVPAGPYRRLGLEVSAKGDLGTLGSTLSLFDFRGRLIATESQGRPDTPGDPYLFAGVAPGIYYVGVSGKANVPGMAGGSDLVKGTSGISGQAEAGGQFLIHYVADIVDRPTRVLGLRVDLADSDSRTPTGLTVQFSGPLREAGLINSSQRAVNLVDSSGQNWPVTLVGYDETEAKLSLVFNQLLPAGRYTLKVSDVGGLVDLAGLAPTSAGDPAGTLGSFTITRSATSPDDFGPIFPGAPSEALSSGVTVASGGSTYKRFQVAVTGFYSIVVVGSTDLLLSVTDPDGTPHALHSDGKTSAQADIFLLPGSYTLTVTNSGERPVTGSIAIRRKQSYSSVMVIGGVAQGPALSLRLVAPSFSMDQGSPRFDSSASPAVQAQQEMVPDTASRSRLSPPTSTSPATPISSESPASGSSRSEGASEAPASTEANHTLTGVDPKMATGTMTATGPAGSSASAARVEAGPGSGPSPPAVSPMSSGSALDFALGPIGRPCSANDQISSVGPSSPHGSSALASNQEGLPSGIVFLPARIQRGAGPESSGWRAVAPASADAVSPGPIAEEFDYGLLSQELSPAADDRILAEADWVDRVAAMTLGRLDFLPRDLALVEPKVDLAEAEAEGAVPYGLLAAGDLLPEETSRIKVASIAPSVGFGMFVMIAYHYRHRFLDNNRRPRPAPNDAIRRPLLKGPHRRTRVLH